MVGTKAGVPTRTTTLGDDNGGRRRVEQRRGSSRCAGPLATGGSIKSREGQQGGRWARSPPLTGPRRLRRPLPPGPARRPGRERVAPGGTEGRRAGPYPCSPRPSPLTTWRPQCKGLRMSRPNRGRSVRPGYPPGPGHKPELSAPPPAPALRKEGAAAALGSQLARRTPPPLVLLGRSFGASPSPQNCP